MSVWMTGVSLRAHHWYRVRMRQAQGIRWGRIGVLALAALILGAASTLGVSLALGRGSLGAPLVGERLHSPFGLLDVSSQDARGHRLLLCSLWWDDPEEPRVAPADTNWSATPAWKRNALRRICAGNNGYYFESGWPCSAMWMRWTWNEVTQMPVGHGGLIWESASLTPRAGFVPLTPLWSGLLIDTTFYSGLWAALLLVPAPLRRYWFLRKGWCTGCGYDLTGCRDSVCPECGRPHRFGKESSTT